jgi:hypothetical protein
MWEMGRQFKAPKQTDIKQWQKVEALVRAGITFHRQRLYQYRNMPELLREVAQFVEEVKKETQGERRIGESVKRRKKKRA